MTKRVGPLVFVVAGVAILVLLSLGTWQVQRLAWKEALIEQVNSRLTGAAVTIEAAAPANNGALWAALPETPEYQPVTVTGLFIPDRVAHIHGTYEGRPGWYVFQALQRLDTSTREPAYGGVLLVNRGFIPDDQRDSGDYGLPVGEVTLEGVIRHYQPIDSMAARFSPTGNDEDGTFYARLAEELFPYFFGPVDTPEQIAPFYLDQRSGDLGSADITVATTRTDFPNNHLGYAITWYGLALGLAGVVFYLWRKGRAA